MILKQKNSLVLNQTSDYKVSNSHLFLVLTFVVRNKALHRTLHDSS